MGKKIADYYDDLYSGEEYVFGGEKGEPHRLVAEAVRLMSPGKALDIGAGEGRNAIFLAKSGFSVEATDISSVGLSKIQARAKKEGVDVRTRAVDLTVEPIEGTFKLIVLSFVSHHLSKTEALKLIGAMKEHIEPGGLNVIMMFTREGDFFKDKPDTDRCYPEKGELKKLYGDWEILVYREEISKTRKKKTDGTPMENLASYLIARRK